MFFFFDPLCSHFFLKALSARSFESLKKNVEANNSIVKHVCIAMQILFIFAIGILVDNTKDTKKANISSKERVRYLSLIFQLLFMLVAVACFSMLYRKSLYSPLDSQIGYVFILNALKIIFIFSGLNIIYDIILNNYSKRINPFIEKNKNTIVFSIGIMLFFAFLSSIIYVLYLNTAFDSSKVLKLFTTSNY